jgi:hypothetical protein
MEHKTAAVAEALRREQRMTLLLRHLLRGTTGVGESFFCGLAESLTAALGVRFAFISVREGDWTSRPPILRLLAFFERGEMLPTFRYDTSEFQTTPPHDTPMTSGSPRPGSAAIRRSRSSSAARSRVTWGSPMMSRSSPTRSSRRCSGLVLIGAPRSSIEFA